jgi:polyphosphate kinase
VISIVDRFLEHSRIYYFANGGEPEVYLASADWMTRNLDRRIELMFPVPTPRHQEQVTKALRAMFQDNTKARQLGADGVYRRRTLPAGEAPFRVQYVMQEEARRGAAAAARDRASGTFKPAVKE